MILQAWLFGWGKNVVKIVRISYDVYSYYHGNLRAPPNATTPYQNGPLHVQRFFTQQNRRTTVDGRKSQTTSWDV